jgi:hypothetical protein
VQFLAKTQGLTPQAARETATVLSEFNYNPCATTGVNRMPTKLEAVAPPLPPTRALTEAELRADPAL